MPAKYGASARVKHAKYMIAHGEVSVIMAETDQLTFIKRHRTITNYFYYLVFYLFIYIPFLLFFFYFYIYVYFIFLNSFY